MRSFRPLLWFLITVIFLASGACAFMYFDDTRVIVYSRELGGGFEISTAITRELPDNLYVTYQRDVRDIREKRYHIGIGKNVFDRYGRNTSKAVQDVTDKIVNELELCAKGWSMVSRGVTVYSGGIGWTVLCNETGA